VENFKSWRWIGGTRDDAAGEAFDKAAKILGLPYPGGPSIQRAAHEYRIKNLESRIKLPRPMIHEDNLEMSFSGLKTALSRLVSENKDFDVNEMAWEFSNAVVEVLVGKLDKAVKQFQPKSILVAGGVAANTHLRKNLEERILNMAGVNLYIPELKYCTDNAAMIGAAAILKPDYVEIGDLKTEPGLEI
jgi:N6-L-threonylcarbamoyladenine synthase